MEMNNDVVYSRIICTTKEEVLGVLINTDKRETCASGMEKSHLPEGKESKTKKRRRNSSKRLITRRHVPMS